MRTGLGSHIVRAIDAFSNSGGRVGVLKLSDFTTDKNPACQYKGHLPAIVVRPVAYHVGLHQGRPVRIPVYGSIAVDDAEDDRDYKTNIEAYRAAEALNLESFQHARQYQSAVWVRVNALERGVIVPPPDYSFALS